MECQVLNVPWACCQPWAVTIQMCRSEEKWGLRNRADCMTCISSAAPLLAQCPWEGSRWPGAQRLRLQPHSQQGFRFVNLQIIASHMGSALFTSYVVYAHSFRTIALKQFKLTIRLSIPSPYAAYFLPFQIFKNFYFCFHENRRSFLTIVELWTTSELWTVATCAFIRLASVQKDCKNLSQSSWNVTSTLRNVMAETKMMIYCC